MFNDTYKNRKEGQGPGRECTDQTDEGRDELEEVPPNQRVLVEEQG